MIAYSEKHEPTSFDKKYKIPDHAEFSEDLFGKIEYHSYLFASGRKDISVLVNRNEVKKAFILHDYCGDREDKIAQYICIPISPVGLGVTFLLQIDTVTPGKFGSDEHSMMEFVNNVIYPFAQFLHMIYEEGRTIEQLTCKLMGGK